MDTLDPMNGIYLFHVVAGYVAVYKVAYGPLQGFTFVLLMVILPWIAIQVVKAPMISVGRFLATRFASGAHSVRGEQILPDVGACLASRESEPTY